MVENLPPVTPTPDPERRPARPPAAGPADLPPSSVSPSSSDDLNEMLSQHSPDPLLVVVPPVEVPDEDHAAGAPGERRSEPSGGAVASARAEPPVGLPIRLSSEEFPLPGLPREDGSRRAGVEHAEEEATGVSWLIVLVGSYASAVTLALAWLLWSGRGPSDPGDADVPARSPSPEAATTSEPARPRPGLPPLPASRRTPLGGPIRLGDLEIVPKSVAYRPVELVRLQGTSDDRRETDAALILTIELRNLSPADTFTPIDASLVREAPAGADQPCVELADGRRLNLFHLATESEWSIAGQEFPALAPGESAETTLVTEPVGLGGLPGPFLWHVRLRTGPFQTDVLGVKFTTGDITDLTQ